MNNFDLNQYLAPERRRINLGRGRHEFVGLAPEIRCADGFVVSVQADGGHYCRPRNDEGPWVSVEVGFPSEPCHELAPYADGDSGVFGYVPVEIVEAIIAGHGGVVARRGGEQ